LAKAVSEDVGQEIIGRHGFIQSRASLENIRRIRISLGTAGHSRTSEHISGLWLDYYGESRSEILGQWIHGVETWEFAQNEKVISVSLWSSKVEECFSSPFTLVIGKPSVGCVIGLSLQTTASTFEIFSAPVANSVKINFRANFLEYLVRPAVSH
jgi:hypothetical protein